MWVSPKSRGHAKHFHFWTLNEQRKRVGIVNVIADIRVEDDLRGARGPANA